MGSTEKTDGPDPASEPARCPVCKADVPPRKDGDAFPFCSPRCQLVDLGNWLDERYRV